MLAYLAAIVPIIASIYAAGSLLVEQTRRSHEARAYARIDAFIKARRAELEDERQGLHVLEFNRRSMQLNERRGILLEASGIDPTTGTHGHVNRILAPTAFPGSEVRRQWVLLLGSIAGVSLLALDAM
jgi:hypothetical protein